MSGALAILETRGITPALVALDVMSKAARLRVVQLELNDLLGVCLKLTGSIADLEAALDAGRQVACQMGGRPVSRLIRRPDERAWAALTSAVEFNPLIQQHVVREPRAQESHVSAAKPFALGFIETQGFTAVFEAIDSACKAANVEVVGKEKLGGGFVTVVIRGDVAAVHAAIEAGRVRVDGLGQLIAAHVIAHPSPSVLSLLPKLA